MALPKTVAVIVLKSPLFIIECISVVVNLTILAHLPKNANFGMSFLRSRRICRLDDAAEHEPNHLNMKRREFLKTSLTVSTLAGLSSAGLDSVAQTENASRES